VTGANCGRYVVVPTRRHRTVGQLGEQHERVQVAGLAWSIDMPFVV
jgi:hypothetical protein